MRASAPTLLGGYRRQTMLFSFRFRDHVDHQDQQLWFDGMAISGVRKNEVIHCRITEHQPKKSHAPSRCFRRARANPQNASAEESKKSAFFIGATQAMF